MNKLLVTGSNGLVGSTIKADIKIGREYDLRDKVETEKMFKTHKPNYVINCAGKVGGIGGNMSYMGEYFYDNLMINTNVIDCAKNSGVEKLISFSSTCVFPKDIEYPITEDKLNMGPPHETNYGYSYAKRMADVQIKAYNEQYKTKYFTVIPSNLYGLNDNYDLRNSHVIPSLIHKTYLAQKNNTNLIVWGTGKALREFMFANDLSDITLKLLESYNDTKPIIVSNSIEVSIEELVFTICEIMGFKNKIIFDNNMPDGQLRKTSDNSFLRSIIGEYEFTPLKKGLELTIEYFIENYEKVRK